MFDETFNTSDANNMSRQIISNITIPNTLNAYEKPLEIYDHPKAQEIQEPKPLVPILKNKRSRASENQTTSAPNSFHQDRRNTIKPYNKDSRKLNDSD